MYLLGISTVGEGVPVLFNTVKTKIKATVKKKKAPDHTWHLTLVFLFVFKVMKIFL